MDLIKLFLGCFIGCLTFVLNIKFLDWIEDYVLLYYVFVVCEMALCIFGLIIMLNSV